jgi:hypothetical protein
LYGSPDDPHRRQDALLAALALNHDLNGVVGGAQRGKRDIRGDPPLILSFIRALANSHRHLRGNVAAIEHLAVQALAIARTGPDRNLKTHALCSVERHVRGRQQSVPGRDPSAEQQGLKL